MALSHLRHVAANRSAQVPDIKTKKSTGGALAPRPLVVLGASSSAMQPPDSAVGRGTGSFDGSSSNKSSDRGCAKPKQTNFLVCLSALLFNIV